MGGYENVETDGRQSLHFFCNATELRRFRLYRVNRGLKPTPQFGAKRIRCFSFGTKRSPGLKPRAHSMDKKTEAKAISFLFFKGFSLEKLMPNESDALASAPNEADALASAPNEADALASAPRHLPSVILV